jgi:WD40 repeat protein
MTTRILLADDHALVRRGLRLILDGVDRGGVQPRRHRLLTGGRDETARVWDPTTATGNVLISRAGIVTSLAVRPDGRVLTAGCADKTVRLWDPATGRSLGNLKGHRGVALFRSVNGVAFSPDGRTLASAGDDGTVRLWA